MKKKKSKAKISKKSISLNLPQNIVSVGERVFEDKNIYIHQKVYSQIHKFASNKTENEHGGILVGRVLNEMGKENTIIEGFIEAKYNAATPTTLTFTHETWKYFHSEMDKKHRDKKIVGWIHTHPNFGIFLSENDKFIQQNFFTDSNQVAYVVDPIQNDEGFYFWINDKLERCPGFYLFDKNGVKIKQRSVKSQTDENHPTASSGTGTANILLAILLIVFVIVNLFVTLYQSKRIKTLEKQVEDQNLIIQYGVFSLFGITGDENMLSDMADNIRGQIEAQKKIQKKVFDTKKQQTTEKKQTSEQNKANSTEAKSDTEKE